MINRPDYQDLRFKVKFKYLILLLGGLCMNVLEAHAQSFLHDVKNAAGGSFSNENYYWEWNIGELTGVKTVQSNGLTVTEGFCQTLFYPLRLDQTERNNQRKQFQLFPVPCQKELFVLSRMSTQVNADVIIVDDAGRIQLRQLLFLNNETKAALNTSQLPTGHYKIVLRFKDLSGVGQTYSYDIIKF